MVGTREGSVLIAEEVPQWKIYSEQVPNSAPFRGQVLITEKRKATFLFSAMTPSRNARTPNRETVSAIR
jgi:hypothetical protein